MLDFRNFSRLCRFGLYDFFFINIYVTLASDHAHSDSEKMAKLYTKVICCLGEANGRKQSKTSCSLQQDQCSDPCRGHGSSLWGQRLVAVEEEAGTVLPVHGCSSSLGIHTNFLRANKKIHGEAMDVLYEAIDWLLVSIEDENALKAAFKQLGIPQRPAIKASRGFAPFMEVRISIGRDYGCDGNGRRLGYFPSNNPRRKFILDLASFQRLCNHRIHQMELFRERTHLQVWHNAQGRCQQEVVRFTHPTKSHLSDSRSHYSVERFDSVIHQV